MKEIKKALIFAAGQGTRLRPLTLSTPKPLMKVNGIPMIETIITSMIANGIEQIFIMLGYQKEKFYYLKEKYSEVIFLENPDYRERNTISSFYHAREILNDDFIISEGDLFISDSKIFKNKISKSLYLYRPDQLQNTEWGFKLDFLTGNVLEIRKPEPTTYLNNNLYGVSFWLKKDLERLKKEIEKKYYDIQYKNSAYDELINNIIGEIEIGVREVNENQIVEIDSLDELFEFDPTYKIFKSVDLLKEELGIKREDITKIYDNPGRSTNNYNYIVEVNEKKYILRIPGVGTELFSNREYEKQGYDQLKNSGLIEENYFLDPISGIKISKYYSNSRIIDQNDEQELKQMMTKIKKLHNGKYKFVGDNVFERIRRYDSYVARVNGRKYYTEEFKKLHKKVLETEAEISKLFEIKPIHGDLSPNNVLLDENKNIILIDLEFISMGDPYTDLATFSHDGNQTPEETIKLLEIYLDRKPNKKEIYKLLKLCSLVSIMWYSWAVFKMAVEEQEREKFRSYRDIYYNYAVIMEKEANKYI